MVKLGLHYSHPLNVDWSLTGVCDVPVPWGPCRRGYLWGHPTFDQYKASIESDLRLIARRGYDLIELFPKSDYNLNNVLVNMDWIIRLAGSIGLEVVVVAGDYRGTQIYTVGSSAYNDIVRLMSEMAKYRNVIVVAFFNEGNQAFIEANPETVPNFIESLPNSVKNKFRLHVLDYRMDWYSRPLPYPYLAEVYSSAYCQSVADENQWIITGHSRTWIIPEGETQLSMVKRKLDLTGQQQVKVIWCYNDYPDPGGEQLGLVRTDPEAELPERTYFYPTPIPPFNLGGAILAGGAIYLATRNPLASLVVAAIGGFIFKKRE